MSPPVVPGTWVSPGRYKNSECPPWRLTGVTWHPYGVPVNCGLGKRLIVEKHVLFEVDPFKIRNKDTALVNLSAVFHINHCHKS